MHEESETVQDPQGRWHNVIGTNRYGKKGEHLSPMFPFETDYYQSVEEADSAAHQRSEEFGKRLDESRNRHSAFEQLMRESPTRTRPR